MANAILSWVNRVDAATFTTDSQTANLPASNLADPIFERVWRTSGTTSAYVEIDFGGSYEIGVLCLAGLNIGASDTIRHRLSNVSSGAGELLDTGATASSVATGYGIAPYVLSGAVTARYWRVDISAPSLASEGFFSVGRAWAGPAFQPTRNIAYGFTEEWIDTSIVRRAERSGVAFIDPRPKYRRLTFGLQHLTEAEAKDEIREMNRLIGISDQLLFIQDPDSSRINSEAIIGRQANVEPITYPTINIFSTAVQITESK